MRQVPRQVASSNLAETYAFARVLASSCATSGVKSCQTERDIAILDVFDDCVAGNWGHMGTISPVA